MTRRLAVTVAVTVAMIVAVALPVSAAGAGQTGHTPTVDPGAVPAASRVDLGIGDTMRALAVLHSFGYRWTTDAGALKAIRAWQRVNGLTADGIVGPLTLASLDIAIATVPAVRVPAAPVAIPAPTGDAESIIRSIWPAELADKAVAIATRESRLVPTAANSCCYGIFQIHYRAHQAWLGQYGVNQPSDLFDPTVNATVAYALYQQAGWQPWSL